MNDVTYHGVESISYSLVASYQLQLLCKDLWSCRRQPQKNGKAEEWQQTIITASISLCVRISLVLSQLNGVDEPIRFRG